MNRGRGRQLLALGAGVLLLGATGAVLIQQVGREDGYARAAEVSARIEHDQFDRFFRCALPGARLSELTAQRVHSAFENLGDRFGKSYGMTLEGCAPQLQTLTESIQTLKVPANVRPQHAALVTATSALRTANTQYLGYLSDSGDYDYVAAMPLLENFGKAWAGYHAAQNDLERVLQERL
jgi:hypothetical protein